MTRTGQGWLVAIGIPMAAATLIAASIVLASCDQQPAFAGTGTDAPVLETYTSPGLIAERLNDKPCGWPACVQFTDGPLAPDEYLDSAGNVFVAPLLPLGIYRSPCQEDEVLYPVDPVTGKLAFPEGVLTCVHMDTFR